MKNLPKKFLLGSAVATATLFATPLLAAPVIDAFSTNASSVTVSGSGFGSKVQAAPVLWIFGSDIRLNGQKSSLEAGLPEGTVIPINTGETSSIWTHGEGVFIDSRTRISSIDHSYGAEGNGWVGWPYAFGGSDTPYSEKAFISWRVRPWGDINNYKAISFNSLSGSFLTGSNSYLPGEAVAVTTTDGRSFSGKVVSIDPSKSIIDLEIAGVSSSFLQGATVVGNQSGAKLILDSSKFYRSSIGTKYLRSYETVNGPGSRAVMSTNRWISLQFDKNGTELRRAFESNGDTGYGVPEISKIQDWVLMESYIDLSGDYGEGYVSANNSKKKWFRSLYIADSKPSDAGPTIANLGWEAAGGTEMIKAAVSFGEIYFDSTPQRVVLSNSGKYSDAGADQEFQWITSWTDKKITVDKSFGGLNKESPIFLYVFDSKNQHNLDGLCIINCDKNLPPTRVELKVN